ncbi:uncharacterized protein LOC126970880 [Leptidea sinapis]|uniref:uncharacterized protein LOC126970880 n=1 Tax=Leptidea sinapis TaxID=189913 RepID=UPI002145C24C|nr:uncharacterized protein LOC126970880 [Leptidea sinapis]
MISEFAKEKVFWTRKMNLNLVKFIQSKQNIWNPRHPKYTSTVVKDKTYAEFATKYGNNFSGQAVKERWTNIRSTFANYLRKVKTNAQSGNEEYKVNWHLWEPCQFLLKVNRSNISTQVQNGECSEIASDLEAPDISDSEIITGTEETRLTCSGVAHSLLRVFRGAQHDPFGLDNTVHGRIGKAVTEKLSQMNSFEAAKLTQMIIDILVMYNIDSTINPNNIKSEMF